MTDIKKYVPSLILSVILVFTLLGLTLSLTAEKYASPQKLISISEENDITAKVKAELEKFFKDKYNETGVPAEVYMNAIDADYIDANIESIINSGFSVLDGEKNVEFSALKNDTLEKNIAEFFSSYANENGYEQDESYSKKLDATISSAYKTVREYCDIYKLVTINSEGILAKTGAIYRHLHMLTSFLAAACAVIAIIILFTNFKNLAVSLYWFGVSTLASGVIGFIPCIILKASSYFDRFVIKQVHIFTSFTKLLYGSVNSFMTLQLIIIAVSVVIFGGYIFFVRTKKSV